MLKIGLDGTKAAKRWMDLVGEAEKNATLLEYGCGLRFLLMISAMATKWQSF